MCTTEDRVVFYTTGPLYNLYTEYLLAPRGLKVAKTEARFDLLNEHGVSELQEKYEATINTAFQEFFYGAIIGSIDVDAAWDGYVATFRKNGGDEILAALEKCPKVSALMEGRIEY